MQKENNSNSPKVSSHDGRLLFRLGHGHKRKSALWTRAALGEHSDNALSVCLPSKTAKSTPSKTAKSTPTKTAKSTPAKTVKSTPKSIQKQPSAPGTRSSARLTPVHTRTRSSTRTSPAQTVRRSARKALADPIVMEESLTSEEEEEIKEPTPKKETAQEIKTRLAASRKQTPRVDRFAKKRAASKALATVESEKSDSSSDSESESEEEQIEEETQAQEGGPSYKTYFDDLNGLKKISTSNHTLSQLPVLDPQEYLATLKTLASKNASQVQSQHARLSEYFQDWYFELSHGFNLLFYGYGSKKTLLEDFCQSFFAGQPVVKVNGFFPNLNIRNVLGLLLELIEHKGPMGTQADQVSLITNYFTLAERTIPRVILLIHNIDGASLRNDKTQSMLSVLAACPNIYVIASVDHINAPLMWDNAKTQQFNWVWHDASTFDPWIVETTFENSILIKSGNLGGRGVIYVLKSLNANARGVRSFFLENSFQKRFLGFWPNIRLHVNKVTRKVKLASRTHLSISCRVNTCL